MKTRKRLGDLLREADIVTEAQIKDTLEKKKTNQKLGDALLERGYITERQLIEVLEFQLGIPQVQLYQYPIDENVLNLIPKELAQRNYLIPLRKKDNALVVAMNDPMDYFIIDDLEMMTGYAVSPVIAAKDDILYAINKYYYKNESIDDIRSEAEDASAVQVLNQLLETGIQLKASDVHIDPQEDNVLIRYRIDGRLQTEKRLPKRLQQSLVARAKIMADLNITETRLPQDGKIKTTLAHTPVDLRISCLPTVFGEKIVIRIMDLNNVLMQLSELSFSETNYQNYQQLLSQPSGLVLLSGPTGSGKTSTLYASINQLNEEDVNIITVEDPVEFQLEGINQVQVNNAIGLDFAKGLRSILRQDPNIIMIGEIRDQETAEIAVRASLTGHLVFSTVHTNSAIDTIPRLIDMGVEPYLAASSLSGVLAQRLVRKVCQDCRTTRELTEMEKEIVAKNDIGVEQIYYGKGCSSCYQEGYRGRIALHELLVVDDTVKSMLLNNRSMAEIKQYEREQGMAFLMQDGLQKVKNGLTTMEEVLQVSLSM